MFYFYDEKTQHLTRWNLHGLDGEVGLEENGLATFGIIKLNLVSSVIVTF
jgi:hypothetical protein